MNIFHTEITYIEFEAARITLHKQLLEVEYYSVYY
jgi:hypothetical protein